MIDKKYLEFNYNSIINFKTKVINVKQYTTQFIKQLTGIVKQENIKNIAYSGGIDSTILLAIMCNVFNKRDITSYSITSRWNHPDVICAIEGVNHFNINHKVLISKTITDGNDAVRKLFKFANCKNMICGDGIDELMCGYYAHQKNSSENYKLFLEALKEKHLKPLNINSRNTKVFLPYLDDKIIKMCSEVSLHQKVDECERKKLMISVGKQLQIPASIINRNKYGFCDAGLTKDK